MVLTEHFRGVSRSPRLHTDTWLCCRHRPRSLSAGIVAQLELPASSWYLAADGSLSMLPDTSNWGLQYHVTLDVQMAWSYGYFAVMVARVSPSLCMPCRTFNSPSQACSHLCAKLTHHAAWSTPSFLLPLYSSPLHMVTWFLPAPRGPRCVFYKHVHRSAPPASLRHGFCGGREVAFSLFPSTPQAMCALVPFSEGCEWKTELGLGSQAKMWLC